MMLYESLYTCTGLTVYVYNIYIYTHNDMTCSLCVYTVYTVNMYIFFFDSFLDIVLPGCQHVTCTAPKSRPVHRSETRVAVGGAVQSDGLVEGRFLCHEKWGFDERERPWVSQK